MTELSQKTRDALMRVATSTLTGALQRRGLRSMFMQDVWPVRSNIKRMVQFANCRSLLEDINDNFICT